MLKTYGVSRDLSYQFNNLLSEEIEKRKEETDSDKLISNDNINSIRDRNYDYYNKNILVPSYILKYRENIEDLRKLKNQCNQYFIICYYILNIFYVSSFRITSFSRESFSIAIFRGRK